MNYLKYVIGLGPEDSILSTARTELQSRADDMKHRLKSKALNWLTVRLTQLAPAYIRREFRELEFSTSSVVNHSHPQLAAHRNKTRAVARNLAMKIGHTVYIEQMSDADQSAGFLGTCAYHWAKDLAADCRADPVPPHPLRLLVDVDYYVDMPSKLLDWQCPVLLYTVVPMHAAGASDEVSYHFLGDVFHMYLSGGGGKAGYSHPLWDYTADVLLVRGLGRYTTYAVERRDVGDGLHQYILLVPIRRGYGPALLDGAGLRRMTVVQETADDSFTVLRTNTYISIARQGDFGCADVPLSADAQLRAYARVAKNRLAPASVLSYVRDLGNASVIAAYYYNTKLPQTDTIVIPVEYAVRRYQQTQHFDVDAKPGLTAFASPIVHGTYSPDQSKDNDRAFVNERILKIQSKPSKRSTMLRAMAYVDEFNAYIAPREGRLHPADYDEVFDKQDRPSQQSILEDGQMMGVYGQRPAQTFQKRDAYGELTDPRGITTIPGDDKLEWSRYCYALSQLFKFTCNKWYAFGHTPVEIAERVAKMCRASEFVALTDFSRMDGRVNDIAREAEKALLLRAFHPDHHVHMLKVAATQHHVHAITSSGIHYDTEYQRLSGSAETSLFNTYYSGLIAYATFRQMGRKPFDAWLSLGIYGGDDGLTPNVDKDVYTRTASSFGQVLDCEVVVRGEVWVKFLSRYYGPDVWSGSPDSTCDVRRQLMKFHTTTNLSGWTVEQKAVAKAQSYLLTDPNTPILSEVCRRILELAKVESVRFDKSLSRWWDRYDAEVQFPNECAAWADSLVEEQLPHFDAELLMQHLRTAQNLTDLLAFPLCTPVEMPKPNKNDTVLDGDMVYGPKTRDSARAEQRRLKNAKTHQKAKDRKRVKNGMQAPTGGASQNHVPAVKH